MYRLDLTSMYKKNAIMFWKAVNGCDPLECSEPIDISNITSDGDTHGTHAYLITTETDKQEIVIGTVIDDGISWRMADVNETKLILEYFRSSEYEPSEPD